MSALSVSRDAFSLRSAVWLATALVLATFVLRVVAVDRRPLHFDEGINVILGQKSPTDILAISRATYDNDPPGHRMALGVWMALAGTSSFSIRMFSVCFSVLVVAALYRLLRNMRMALVPALIAAALVAISPYAIDYGQQAKGYAMGAGLAMVSWLMWIDLVAPGRRVRKSALLRAVTYVIATALALSTHYYVLLLLPMQWLWFAGTHVHELHVLLRPHTWKQTLAPIMRGALAQALAIMPIGVWLALMAASLQVSTARSSTKFTPASPIDLLENILGEMSVGQFVDHVPQLICGSIVLALALIGAVRLWHATGMDRCRSAFWFGIAAIVPLAGAVILQQRVTFFFPRFLQYMLPSLIVLVTGCALPFAAAPRRLSTALRAAPVAVAAGAMLIGVSMFYTAPIDGENDFRPLIAQMRHYIRPGDAALGAYIWMEGMFDSYAPESNDLLTWYEDTYSADNFDALVAPIASAHPRVWSINYRRDPDAPDTLSTLWLKQNAAYVERFNAGATTALLFDTRTRAGVSVATVNTTTVTFGDRMIQLQYMPLATHATTGDSIPIELTWTALRPIDDHIVIYMHLLTTNGELMAQNDGDAVNGLAPSFTWTVGQPVIEQRAVAIPSVLPGEYTLVIGLFRQSDRVRLVTSTGADNARIGTITVGK